MTFDFEWDAGKRKQNLRKHKVSFERATEIFLDPFAISIFDSEHSSSEHRWISIGKDSNSNLLVVVHTFREAAESQTSIRIISARKATKREVKQYEEI